jgi:hypothetical protein
VEWHPTMSGVLPTVQHASCVRFSFQRISTTETDENENGLSAPRGDLQAGPVRLQGRYTLRESPNWSLPYSSTSL